VFISCGCQKGRKTVCTKRIVHHVAFHVVAKCRRRHGELVGLYLDTMQSDEAGYADCRCEHWTDRGEEKQTLFDRQ
jgi:predicted GNAT superfamily acetyltransferase